MRRRLHRALAASLACLLTAGTLVGVPQSTRAATGAVGSASARPATPGPSAGEGSQLESAAHRAGETGRRVAMSLIALGFAIAAIVLAFRRDFKEAVGVFAVGVVAVLLAQEAGVQLVENLVHSLFGS